MRLVCEKKNMIHFVIFSKFLDEIEENVASDKVTNNRKFKHL